MSPESSQKSDDLRTLSISFLNFILYFPFLFASFLLIKASITMRAGLTIDTWGMVLLAFLTIYFQVAPDAIVHLSRKSRVLNWMNYGWASLINILLVLILSFTLKTAGLFVLFGLLVYGVFASRDRWQSAISKPNGVLDLAIYPLLGLTLFCGYYLFLFLFSTGWASNYASPFFDEQLSQLARVNRDTIFHMAVATGWKNQFLPMVGLDGFTTLNYHTTSHLFMAAISLLTGRSTSFSYNFFFLTVIYPSFLQTIYRVCTDFVSKPASLVRLGIFILLTLSVIQFQTNATLESVGLYSSFVVSESYAFGLWLLVIVIGAFSFDAKGPNLSILASPTPRAFYILSPILLALVTYAKVTTGFIASVFFALLVVRVFIRDPRRTPYLLVLISAAASLGSFLVARPELGAYFAKDYFLTRYTNTANDLYFFYSTYYQHTWMALALLLAFTVYQWRQGWNREYLSITLLLSFFVAITFLATLPASDYSLAAGNAYYFTNVTMWVAIVAALITVTLFLSSLQPRNSVLCLVLLVIPHLYWTEKYHGFLQAYNVLAAKEQIAPLSSFQTNRFRDYRKYLAAFRQINKTTSPRTVFYLSRNEDRYWSVFADGGERCQKAAMIPVVLSGRVSVFPFSMREDGCRIYPESMSWVAKDYYDISPDEPIVEICQRVVHHHANELVIIKWNQQNYSVDLIKKNCLDELANAGAPKPL